MARRRRKTTRSADIEDPNTTRPTDQPAAPLETSRPRRSGSRIPDAPREFDPVRQLADVTHARFVALEESSSERFRNIERWVSEFINKIDALGAKVQQEHSLDRAMTLHKEADRVMRSENPRNGNGGAVQAASDDAMPPVARAFGHLGNCVATFEDTLNVFEKRIQPALRPDPPQASATTNQTSPGFPSSGASVVANTIDQISMRMIELNERFGAIVRRIEI